MPPFGVHDKGKAPATTTTSIHHADADEACQEERHSQGTPRTKSTPGLSNRLLHSARTLLNPTLTPSDITTALDVRLDQGKSTETPRPHATSHGSTATPELYEYETQGRNSENSTAHLSRATSARSKFLSPGRFGLETRSVAQRTEEDSLTQLCTAVNHLDLLSTPLNQRDPVLRNLSAAEPTRQWRAPPTHEACQDIIGLLNHSQGLFDEVFYTDPQELTRRHVNQQIPLVSFAPDPPPSSNVLATLTDKTLDHAVQHYLTEFISYTDEVYGTGIASTVTMDGTSRITSSDNDHSQILEKD
ncbi:hypothetical protein IWQ62_002972, partial [Dispira parvispora]